MASTNPHKKRRKNDFYATPKWVVRQCVNDLLVPIGLGPGGIDEPTRIFDPCAGNGRFINVLRRHYPRARYTALDIQERFYPWPNANKSVCKDFLRYRVKPGFSYDLTISNPPYSLAQEFIEHARDLSEWVVFLLRMDFLASKKRFDVFHRRHKPAWVGTLATRPSFTKNNGTDTSNYCWVVWSPYQVDQTQLLWLPPVEPRDR